MFLSIFLLAKAAKLHISRQRYCFFCTYASAKRIFFNKKSYFPSFLLPFPCHLGKYHPPLHLTLYTTPTTFTSQNDANNTLFHIKTCIYQPKALLLQRKSDFSPHKMMWIRYLGNYGTQILSSLWCCVYLPAWESRQVPMRRRGTLTCCSCPSSRAIPQSMPLPQVPHRIRNIQLTPFAACLYPSSYSAPSCYCSALLWYGCFAGS